MHSCLTIKTVLNEKDLSGEEIYAKANPIARLGQPEDMVGPAVLLAGGLSKYVNGAQLLVDVGLFMNL